MAGHAGRRIRVAGRGRLSVDTLTEFLHFIGVTLRALCGRGLGRRGHFVVIAVAGLAGSVAERAVHTVGHMGSFVTVASRAFYLRYFGGVRIVLDAYVTFSAAQNAVDAGRVLGGINRDAFPAVRLHACLAVAGQATFVLPQRLR
jgi:hypothetical protein